MRVTHNGPSCGSIGTEKLFLIYTGVTRPSWLLPFLVGSWPVWLVVSSAYSLLSAFHLWPIQHWNWCLSVGASAKHTSSISPLPLLWGVTFRLLPLSQTWWLEPKPRPRERLITIFLFTSRLVVVVVYFYLNARVLWKMAGQNSKRLRDVIATIHAARSPARFLSKPVLLLFELELSKT